MHLHAKGFLFAMAKTIGIPLHISKATTDLWRPIEARVCVEVNLEHKLHDMVWINCSVYSFWQVLTYDNYMYSALSVDT